MTQKTPPIIFLSLLLASAVPGAALAQSYDAELARADVPDTTPQQRYRSAIREAGGGLKIGLAECRALPAGRQACEAEARARYQEDMRAAKRMLEDPQARPVNEMGGPIRATETITVTRP
ncbi:hypothetical protein [Simplicispira lacusdiani]|uniref:hypothetical protein n=1 Tax=Simplicispira lacusdiani TaxID=2213010 RepID=UPI000E738BC8|nr:hypothetical protein [Simplicispira lacusdiani]